MKLKNIHIGLLIIAIGCVGMLISRRLKNNRQKRAYTIGILQTASHPALDAAREGFIDEFQEKMADKVDFVIRNGQGSINNMYAIAQQFHARDDIDAIFAIATPAAQAIISVEKEKPIIVAAVSVAPGLVDNFSASNICGVSDMIDVAREIQAMKEIVPAEAQSVGIIFCSGEVNSVSMAHMMSTELERAGYVPTLVSVASEPDMQAAVMSAARRVDILLAPTDNIVANSIALIADIATKAHKPLIVSDNLLVKEGALMARGVDYYESGKQAGAIAIKIIIKQAQPYEISVISADNKEIYVNEEVLNRFGYSVSDEIASDVILV
jgi:putative tryptophan/tyrosine transport system substrate-binding protein